MARKALFNERVTNAIADIQEDYDMYDRWLDDLMTYLLDTSGDDGKKLVAQVYSVHNMRRLLRDLSGREEDK